MKKITVYGQNRFDSMGDALGANREQLTISSNHYGTHEKPSVYMEMTTPFEEPAVFGTGNIEDIKKIILHMAKMSGLTVTIEESA